MRTVPVKYSAGPVPERCEPFLLTSMMHLPPVRELFNDNGGLRESDTRDTCSGCRSCRQADNGVDDVGSVAAVFADVAFTKGASLHCSFPCYGSSSVMREGESVGQPTV